MGRLIRAAKILSDDGAATLSKPLPPRSDGVTEPEGSSGFSGQSVRFPELGGDFCSSFLLNSLNSARPSRTVGARTSFIPGFSSHLRAFPGGFDLRPEFGPQLNSKQTQFFLICSCFFSST